MTKIRSFTILLLAATIISCRNSTPTDSQSGTNKVSGTLVVDGKPLDAASVQIDEVLNWRAATDSSGDFEIQNVTSGMHTFNASKTMSTGEVVKQTAQITVGNSTTDLGEIQLPQPSHLEPLDSGSMTSNGVQLRWSQSNDVDFREYKLYRKTDAGLDETTGELIYVATSIPDTQYVDDTYSGGLTYYYRVFILSAYGKMGGSNMVNIKTPPPNYVINGGFEESSGGVLPDSWTYISPDNAQTYIQVTSDEHSEGSYSLHVSLVDSSDNQYGQMYEGFIRQTISTLNLPKNRQYRFSARAKSHKGKPAIYLVVGDPFAGNSIYTSLQTSSGADWVQYSATFTLSEGTNSVDVFVAAFEENREDYQIDSWVDDVRLSLAE